MSAQEGRSGTPCRGPSRCRSRPNGASSTLAYRATLEGQGIMMAQNALVAEDLRARRLVQPFGPALDRGAFT